MSTSGFIGSSAKETARRLWDLPIIRRRAEVLQTKLSYLGLPRPDLKDLSEWAPFLGQRTAVERLRKPARQRAIDQDVHRQMLVNVMTGGLSDGFELLRGQIEDIIIGRDVDGEQPALSYGDPVRFHDDLVNLDFVGGIAHPLQDEDGEA